jgi:hypothetical protein
LFAVVSLPPTALVPVSGYLIGSQAANQAPRPPQAAEHAWWYQFYCATDRGRAGYGACRRDFSRLSWQLASPKWAFDDATLRAPRPPSTTPITSRT